MKNLTIIANVVAKADAIELVKSELLKLIIPTRMEEGCMQYDLHQDDLNPEHFVFYEKWASRELLQHHLATAHIANYIIAVEGLIESFVLSEMSQIA